MLVGEMTAPMAEAETLAMPRRVVARRRAKVLKMAIVNCRWYVIGGGVVWGLTGEGVEVGSGTLVEAGKRWIMGEVC